MDFTRAMSSLNFGCKFLLIAKKYNSGQKETKIGNGERRTETEGKGHSVYHSDITAVCVDDGGRGVVYFSMKRFV